MRTSGSLLFSRWLIRFGQSKAVRPPLVHNPYLVQAVFFGTVPYRMKKSGCLPLVLFLLLCASLFGNVLLLVMIGKNSGQKPGLVTAAGERQFQEEIISGSGERDRVVVIPMRGLISYSEPGLVGESMVEDLTHAFRQAGDDPRVVAVVLQVDSPGGEMTAGDQIYHELTKLRAKKPVVVYMTSLGASAAYYISCGASWIMANESTFTGSIGVIISTLYYENLFDKLGLKSVVFKSGAFKDMLSGTRPMTDDEREYVQALVMQAYDRFVKLVASSRKLDEQALRTGIADGRVLSGQDALKEKLLDQVGYEEDAFEKARELAGSPDAMVVRYTPQFGFSRLLRMFGEAKTPRVEVDILRKSSIDLEPGRLYLLPAFFAP